ncbi:MAG TPA: UDP-N-acetylglucosamine 1-carboxyvinyltransferase [bacterium]|nr:UDP-N-acetylglucosamine 1-carboxyvinyltransferase [bacterium]HQO34382.1 UDP-N-acetylglucosamine 1-carboxyvinyltransferase [bacterium]HQP99683.1 UDP-N-acetylglucosamine 1-carboxyvinyltransferase [bacterium]
MARFVVEGGNPLGGEFIPSGNKNEALPVLSACLLTREEVHLENLPDIGDVRSMLQLLEEIGAIVERIGPHEVKVKAQHIGATSLPKDVARGIRGSITLAAPLLARCGRTQFPQPGGDRIGRRRIDSHLLGFQQMGVHCSASADSFHLWCGQRLKGADILMDEASVTGTENLVMASVLAEGQTIIRNAACEPSVQQLCRFLNTLGAEIGGIGSNVLTIDGVEDLEGGTHRIAADYVEIGSVIGLAAVTGSDILIRDVPYEDLRMILYQFGRLGIDVTYTDGVLHVPPAQSLEVRPDILNGLVKIDDAPWPGFPADLTSIAVVIATQTRGSVMVFEKMYESRLFFVDRLIGMGANIILCDPHRAVIIGSTKLRGSVISSPDIRAGMALLIAALCATGESVIQNIEQIDRGYEKLDNRLRQLGAHIVRTDD